MFISFELFLKNWLFTPEIPAQSDICLLQESHTFFFLAASYRHFNCNLSDNGLDYISLKF